MNGTISYRLLDTLKRGKERLGKEALGRVIRFVESQQAAGEAFRNKSGQADLYYTVFGWSLSYVLGIRQDLRRMAAWLDSLPPAREFDLIHAAASVRCRMIWQLRKKGVLGFFLHHPSECPDIRQGFPNDDPHAPYSQFLLLSMREDCRQSIREKEAILHTIVRYRASGGGYANRENETAATANATVAALAVRGQLEGYIPNDDVTCLREMQEPSGGFCAAAESPAPDLLSTATALFMLNCYHLNPKYNAARFIDAHWLDCGGFAATLLEENSDVEYTFYGLLALGSL